MSVLIEITKDGAIAQVRLNRPEAYNSFNLEMVASLASHLVNLSTDDDSRGILITGMGHAFCAGGDLKWAADYARRPGTAFHTLASHFHSAILEIRRMKKPVVAAINGIAAGGGFSLALACDFRIMEESAVLRQAYTSNGLSIDGGGTFTLPRLVGYARALEIAAFDKPISAKQAYEWGMVTGVVSDGESVPAGIEMLKRLAQNSLHSFGLSKNLLNDGYVHSLETQLELEREGLSAAADHPDGQEGLKAFKEKRKPVFYEETD